jgi:hypothetical protein
MVGLRVVGEADDGAAEGEEEGLRLVGLDEGVFEGDPEGEWLGA